MRTTIGLIKSEDSGICRQAGKDLRSDIEHPIDRCRELQSLLVIRVRTTSGMTGKCPLIRSSLANVLLARLPTQMRSWLRAQTQSDDQPMWTFETASSMKMRLVGRDEKGRYARRDRTLPGDVL